MSPSVRILPLLAALAAAIPPAARGQVPDASSAVSIDFATLGRTVPPLLFGQNLETIERGNGLLRADGKFDAELIALLDEARVTSLRYPGGTGADFLHWWQAIGPHSSRRMQSSGYLNEFYLPVVGPDEFVKASIALRATPLVVANTGTGSAVEAAALARYFSSRGLPAQFWEIGNEIYFEGITENGLAGLPPDTYARKVIEYAAAIRKESPSAKIYAAGLIGPQEKFSYWNAVVLGIAGSYIDGVSIHNAYYPLFGVLADGTVPADDYLYRAMLAATRAVDTSTTAVESQLASLGMATPIFVTEYDGVFYPNTAIEPVDVTFRRNATLACALYNASVLQIFMRHDRVQGAHHMGMVGPLFGGLVGVEGEARFRNPQFYVHREYAREAGNVMVRAVVDPRDAVFSSGPIKLLPALVDVPMLDAVATRSPDGLKRSIFVVNRSLDTAVSANVAIDGTEGGPGKVSVLDGPDPGARNSAAEPDRVTLVTRDFAVARNFTYRFPPHSLTIIRW
jgi:alpha-L-arabinofuranosidase